MYWWANPEVLEGKAVAAENFQSRRQEARILQDLEAAEFSFLFGVYGDSFMPVPKVQFLHRQLLDIATLLRLDALTNKGLEEFFEDVCPCGKKHNAETIRKLRKRKAR